MAENKTEKPLDRRNYWYLFLLPGVLLNFPFDGLVAFTGTVLMVIGTYKLTSVLFKNPNLGGNPRSDRIIRVGVAILTVLLLLSIRVLLGMAPDADL